MIPLLQLLGYDVFDPREVKPEFTSDFAAKRAGQLEKIDYAICQNNEPTLFVECKAHDQKLDDHTGQLARYFNAMPSVRVALLTNGVRLKLFTDLQQTNMMDPTPWLEIDLLNLNPVETDALRRLRKSEYAAEDIVSLAEEMVYYRSMASYVSEQFREPRESFVRHVASEVLPSTRLTKGLVDRLSPILKKAIQSAVLENVAKSFSTPRPDSAVENEPPSTSVPAESTEQPIEGSDGVITTEDELWCYEQISSWLRDTHPDAEIAFRDSKSYLTVHQNNLRKWFVRLNVQKAPFWVAFRHVTPEDMKLLAPGLPHAAPGAFGDSRVTLASVSDFPILRSAIIAAYDREAAPADDSKAADAAVGE